MSTIWYLILFSLGTYTSIGYTDSHSECIQHATTFLMVNKDEKVFCISKDVWDQPFIPKQDIDKFEVKLENKK